MCVSVFMCVCMQTLFYSYRCVWLQSLNFVVFFEPSFLMHILSVGCSGIVSHLFIFSIHAFMRMCLCVCVRAHEREREMQRPTDKKRV
jgi:dihydrodipicolinate synthase/N-acetylneuraminate lyase